ncbi:AF4/FMR2 family member 4 isoform X1 [Vespula maculifrons]|uniref:AF4/FMR2 family member 4 isoform X1 n=1 Tax=Vespula maculifrons TaxID=7453 RepID=A0ABD2B5F0_VESMC
MPSINFDDKQAFVNPDTQDRTTQQIQSKLGNYSLVKHLLDEPKRLIGIEGVPASPAPTATSSSHRTSVSAIGSSSRSSPSPQEFKKPGGPRTSISSSSTTTSSTTSSTSSTSSSSTSSSHQRGAFVKPVDGKPPYGGRTGYSGPLMKHSGNSSNDHRNHSLLPLKGQPVKSPGNILTGNASSIGNSANRLHTAASRLSRLPLDNVSKHNSSENSADVENILKDLQRYNKNDKIFVYKDKYVTTMYRDLGTILKRHTAMSIYRGHILEV